MGCGYCDDEDKYVDFDDLWNPYSCCDQLFTDTEALKLHKLRSHGYGSGEAAFIDDSDDSFDAPLVRGSVDDFGEGESDYSFDSPNDCVDSSFDSSDELFNVSEGEAIAKYSLVMISKASPSTKSQKKYRRPRTRNSRWVQDDGVPFVCPKCGMGFFLSKGPYLLHMAMCHKVCGVCELGSHHDQTTQFQDEDHFSYAQGCARHAKLKSGGNGRFICPTCGDRHTSGKALNQHCATVHMRCRVCRIQFDSLDGLSGHFSSSNVHFRKYCKPCKMAFACRKSLSVHRASGHRIGGSPKLGKSAVYPITVSPNSDESPVHPITVSPKSGESAIHPITVIPTSGESAVHPITMIPKSGDSAVHPITMSPKSDESAIHPITASPKTGESAVHSITVSPELGLELGTSAIHPITVSPKSDESATHPITVSPKSGESAVHPITVSPELSTSAVHQIAGSPKSEVYPATGSPQFGTSGEHPIADSPKFGKAAVHPTTTSPKFGKAAVHPATTSPKFGKAAVHSTTTSPKFGKAAVQPTTTCPKFGKAGVHPIAGSPKFGKAAVHPSTTNPTFDNLSELVVPIEVKLGTSEALWWTCFECTKVRRQFTTEEKLEAHLEFEHIRCFPCKREFVRRKNLYDHLVDSSKHNFCIRCDSDFVSAESLRGHNCPAKSKEALKGPQMGSVDGGSPLETTAKSENPLDWVHFDVLEAY